MRPKSDTAHMFPTDPTEIRARFRSVAQRILASAFASSDGLTQDGLAAHHWVSRARVAKWLDGSMPLERVVGAPLPFVRGVVRELAATCGLTVTDAASEAATTSDAKSLASAMREASEAFAQYADSTADGIIDAQEAAAIRQSCREARDAIARIEARADDAVAKRGVPVRGVA